MLDHASGAECQDKVHNFLQVLDNPVTSDHVWLCECAGTCYTGSGWQTHSSAKNVASEDYLCSQLSKAQGCSDYIGLISPKKNVLYLWTKSVVTQSILIFQWKPSHVRVLVKYFMAKLMCLIHFYQESGYHPLVCW